MKFSIKYFFSKCDEIPSFLQIWSHLLKKSLTENFIFCAVIGWVPSFFLLEIVTLLVLLHLGLEGVTEADTDPKEKFLSSKVTLSLSNDRVLCVYAPSGDSTREQGDSTREQLARGCFHERLHN